MPTYRRVDDAECAAASGGIGATTAERSHPEGPSVGEMQARLAAIVEASEDAVSAATLDGRFISWNAGAERLFGYSAAEAIGSPVSIILPEDRRDERRDFIARLQGGERIPPFDTVRLTKDGRRITVSVGVSPIRDGEGALVAIATTARDISARQRAEDALKESEERFRVALQAAEIGAWNWTVGSDRVEWSGNLEQIHGLAPGSFDGTFAAFQGDIHPDDRDRVVAAIARTLEDGSEYRVDYRLAGSNSPPRWVEARGRLLTRGGGPARMTGICMDVTPRKLAEAQLQARVRQQQAVARLGSLAIAGGSLDELMQETVRLAAETLEVELCKILELQASGHELTLRAGVGWRDGLVGTATVDEEEAQAGYTLACGEPVVVENLTADSRFHGLRLLHDHGVISGISVAIAGDAKRPYGVLGVHSRQRRRFTSDDVAFVQSVAHVLAGAIHRKRSEERQHLLMRELNHRVKNTLAVVQSIASQTVRRSASLEDFQHAFIGRLGALARAHGLLIASGWGVTELQGLLREAVGAYGDRIAVEAPKSLLVSAEAAVALSMILHELTTNAVKHGALSTPNGSVRLTCCLEGEGDDRCLCLTWVELGGPHVPTPGGNGFGSDLIRLSVQHPFGGNAEVAYQPQGVHWRLTLPWRAVDGR